MIKDAQFIWKIDNLLLKTLKNMHDHWVYLSDMFADNCLILKCRRCTYQTDLGLKLLRKPHHVDKYIVDLIWTIYYNNKRYLKRDNWRALKLNKTIWHSPEFLNGELLSDIQLLVFEIDIKVVCVIIH